MLQGFRSDEDFDTAKDLLTSLPVLNVLDTAMALKSAENFRALRKLGVTVRKTIDVIIASYCVEHDLPLLHADKDFVPFHQHLGLRDALRA